MGTFFSKYPKPWQIPLFGNEFLSELDFVLKKKKKEGRLTAEEREVEKALSHELKIRTPPQEWIETVDNVKVKCGSEVAETILHLINLGELRSVKVLVDALLEEGRYTTSMKQLLGNPNKAAREKAREIMRVANDFYNKG